MPTSVSSLDLMVSLRAVGGELKACLSALEQAARSSGNLMPHILACSEAYATVGEISDRLRAVFGEYQEC